MRIAIPMFFGLALVSANAIAAGPRPNPLEGLPESASPTPRPPTTAEQCIKHAQSGECKQVKYCPHPRVRCVPAWTERKAQ